MEKCKMRSRQYANIPRAEENFRLSVGRPKPRARPGRRDQRDFVKMITISVSAFFFYFFPQSACYPPRPDRHYVYYVLFHSHYVMKICNRGAAACDYLFERFSC